MARRFAPSVLRSCLATLGNPADVAQLVERNLAKVEVAGSNPVVRSNRNPWSEASNLRPGVCSLWQTLESGPLWGHMPPKKASSVEVDDLRVDRR